MIVSIHQPNFFPWLGFFQKIARADIFVFLDAVPFPRTSRGNWANRTRLLINGEGKWLTCPVSRENPNPLIRDVVMSAHAPWQAKLQSTLIHHYGKHKHFEQIFPLVSKLLEQPVNNLASFNETCITSVANWLNLEPRFIRQSQLTSEGVFNLQGSRRLAAICHELKADTYLAGDGSQGYEDEKAYSTLGIKLIYNNFNAKPYHQKRSPNFVAGLSILDALFNLGKDTVQLLEKGIQNK